MNKPLKSLLLLAFGTALYMSTLLSPVLFFDYSNNSLDTSNVKLIAHRGAAQIAPENTMAAINLALDAKPYGIEIDVHQTKDSTIILMHDLTLDRTTNGKGIIKEYNFSELNSLDVGSWFSKDFVGEKIPTLDQVIKTINGRCKLIVEIKKGKEYYPNIEQNILRIIDENSANDWVVIHSFETNVLVEVNKLNPNIRLHKLLVGQLSLTPLVIVDGIESYNFKDYAFVDEYSVYYAFANERLIYELTQQGKKVNVWTVNDLEIAKRLLSIGVNAVITDNPNLIKK